MAAEFSNYAGWSRNDNTWRYDQTLKIKNSEFTFGKEFYTLKVTCKSSDGSRAEFISKYYPVSDDDMPALYLFGDSVQEGEDYLIYYTAETGIRTQLSIKRTTSNIDNIVNATTRNDFGSDIDFTYNQSNGWLIYGLLASDYYGNDGEIEIEADFPIFLPNQVTAQGSREISHDGWYVLYSWDLMGWHDDGTCNTYLGEFEAKNYTHINQAVNYYSVTGEIPNNQVWSIRSHLKKNGAVVGGSYKAYDFKILPDAKIWLVWSDRTTGDDSPNLILHINNSPWLQKPCNAPDSAYTETSSLDTDYWRGDWQDYDTGDSYTGWCSTNIPIFTSDAKGDAYGRGEIGIDEALNGGGTSFHISTIGDDLSSSEIPTVNLATSGVGCYIYALSSSQLKEIMSNYLYTNDTDLKAAYVDALWMWGNNPIDFMIDLYYIPFSISNFYDTNNANLKFGTYQIPDTSYPVVIESNGDHITLFETSFEPIYNDWRDYTQFDYDLFLPYVGWFSLDPQKYINKMVRCEMMFDITTHNLRYYLFADDIITDRVDGSVGINLPLMATDQVNKAKNDRAADRKMVGLAAQTAGGIISGAANLMVGNVNGAVSNIAGSAINDITGAMEIYDMKSQKAKQSVEGSFSSAMNIYDIKYAYLRITEKPLLMPDKLHDLYGYPCYYMGKASALGGYCEISDIRLNGFTGTKEEAEALKITLREGVIL